MQPVQHLDQSILNWIKPRDMPRLCADSHVVLKRGADKALGRLLRQGFDVRQDADYDGPSISIERARRAVENADQFIAAIEQFLAGPAQ